MTALELLINNCHQSLESPNYIDNLSVFFQAVKDLGVPLDFQQDPVRKPALLIFGDIGNGKSTTSNYIMFQLDKKAGRKFDTSQCFECHQGTSAVTEKIQQREFKEMIIIDTPGHNDPDQENRDDTKLSSSIVRYLRDNELLQQ